MATDRPGARDPFDFGFRCGCGINSHTLVQVHHCSAETTTQRSTPENPLDAFREAASLALDAGMSVDDMMAVVEEAARGGAPVMRYRAWSPDGSMVDAPPPTMQVLKPPPDLMMFVRVSSPAQADGNTMSKAQLREVAERHGLSYERLLEDARRKGVALVE